MDFSAFRTRWRDEIKPQYHYNPDLHAETVTYTPVNAGDVGVIGNVDWVDQTGDGIVDQTSDQLIFWSLVGSTPLPGREINVHIVDDQSLDIEDEDSEYRTETITVKCFKSATTGIDRPNIGDTIVRAAAHDIDSTPYVYQGEDEHQGRDDWRLRFTRRRRDAQGVSR